MLPVITVSAPADRPGHDLAVLAEARSSTGLLLGSALARRAPMAIAYFEALEQGMPRVGYENELDTVRFLADITVGAEHRRAGVGTALLDGLADHLAAEGVRLAFGGLGRDSESVGVARFLEGRGAQIMQPGQRLPGFFGRRWTLPHTAEPANWFFLRLAKAETDSARA